MTTEYGPGWKRCGRCGLTAPDMVGTPPRCALRSRCDASIAGKGFGGKPLGPSTPAAPRDGATSMEVPKE